MSVYFAVFVTAVLALWLAAVLYESKGSQSHRTSEFCYVNSFEQSAKFRPIIAVPATRALLEKYADVGQPFVVSGVTRGWDANTKWNHSYFEELFQEFALFSSTFATEKSPHFSVSRSVALDVYYGIFLNDRKLADLVAGDYSYPEFIPSEWRVTGNEWLHWGHPPCGAKRHMDLMCTSRVSVQVTGRKTWRLYPLVGIEEEEEEEEEEKEGVKGIENWTEVLHPLEVTLQPGDALVWFPGWEHETRILTGPSISLSLHFTSPTNSAYQNTFSEILSQKVSPHCKWRDSSDKKYGWPARQG